MQISLVYFACTSVLISILICRSPAYEDILCTCTTAMFSHDIQNRYRWPPYGHHMHMGH